MRIMMVNFLPGLVNAKMESKDATHFFAGNRDPKIMGTGKTTSMIFVAMFKMLLVKRCP